MKEDKIQLLQHRAMQAINYALQNEINGIKYTQASLARALNVKRSFINHIIKGRKPIELTRIVDLERIIGIPLFAVLDVEKFKNVGKNKATFVKSKMIQPKQKALLMEDNFQGFGFYNALKKDIKSTIEAKYPVEVVYRNRSQYVSLNIFGHLVQRKLHKSNLHVLFFKFVKNSTSTKFKIEFMISRKLFQESLSDTLLLKGLPAYIPNDDVIVTDYSTLGKQELKRGRPVYIIDKLSASEITSLADLSLAVFEIQCGLFVKR